MKRRKLRDSVVVITGASSGIGRATALRLAAKRATVVLAARGQEALAEVAEACEQAGGRAIVAPTDVTDAGAVQALAQRAVAEAGRIDAWCNNAGVYLLGRFDEVPLEDVRRVLDVNVMGVVHGARAALEVFRRQGSGVLINVGSMVSKAPTPYTSAYVMSKHAVRAMSECLRSELLDAPGIEVCTVLPAAIDTPLFHHTANYTGRKARPPRPVHDVDDVAEAIVSLIRDPERERFVGTAGRVTALSSTLAGGSTERAMGRMMDREHFLDEPAAPSPGNLYEPSQPPRDADGGWRRNGRRTARRVLLAAGAVGTAVAVAGRRDGS